MRLFSMTIFLVMLLCISCITPYSISSLKSEDKKAFWINGKEFIIKETPNSRVEIAFIENNRNYFIFDFFYINKSSDTVLIDPSNFWINTYRGFEHPIKKNALTPEKSIIEIRRNIAQNEADQANQAISNVLESSLEITEGLTTPAEEKDETYYEGRNNDRLVRLEEEQYSERIEQNLKSRKAFFEQEVLSKNSVLPLYNIEGQVFFPRDPRPSGIKLFLPVGNDTLSFSYQHILR